MTLRDKIKGLENQLEYQNTRVKKLREENAMLRESNTQIQRIMDATLISIAQQYGPGRIKNGYVIVYRQPDVEDLNKYVVDAQRHGDCYRVTVKPRKETPLC